MKIVIGFFGAYTKGGYGSAPVKGFPAVVDNPLFHEGNNPIRQQFSMNPQMFFVIKMGQNGIRGAAVPYL